MFAFYLSIIVSQLLVIKLKMPLIFKKINILISDRIINFGNFEIYNNHKINLWHSSKMQSNNNQQQMM